MTRLHDISLVSAGRNGCRRRSRPGHAEASCKGRCLLEKGCLVWLQWSGNQKGPRRRCGIPQRKNPEM